MSADFELKPTTTYDADVLRRMLQAMPDVVRQDADLSVSWSEEASANALVTHEQEGEEPSPPTQMSATGSGDVGYVHAGENVDHCSASTTPETASFAAWKRHLTEERERAHSRTDWAEDQAAFANELDEHGRAEAARGAHATARALIEKAVEIRRRLYGEQDPRLLQSFSWLGALALQQGDIEQAEWLYQQALATAERQVGAEHPRTATALHNLGLVALRRGDLERAADLYERALAIKLQHGWEHATVAATLVNLGNLARRQGDLGAALQYYARSREIYERTLGGTNPGLGTALMGMGRVYLQLGRAKEARFVLERALRIREALDVVPIQLAGVRMLLAQAIRTENPTQAQALATRALHDYETSPHPQAEHLTTLRAWVERLTRGQ